MMKEGQILGHYRIIHQLGLGGMGEVYLAEDTKLRREVAIKVLPESLHHDQQRMRRFRQEAIVAARLNHPNIATIYSLEDMAQIHFITMEYVNGETFSIFNTDEGISVDRLLEWFIPLAGALHHAHTAHVVHRDLKPSNLMLSAQGLPKILDFGMAHLLETRPSDLQAHTTVPNRLLDESSASERLTSPGQAVGTPAYMSPEQTQGRPVDLRSDIFSFGVVIYEMLAGQRPFTGQDAWEIMAAIRMQFPRFLHESRPDLPLECIRLVDRCLQKMPEDRYQTMLEVQAALEEVSPSEKPVSRVGHRGPAQDARAEFSRRLELARAAGRNKDISDSLSGLAVIARSLGNYDEAKSYYAENLDIALASDDKTLTREVLWNMGDILRTTGDNEEARVYYIDSLKLALESGEKKNISQSMWGLGMVALAQGVHEEARALFSEALTSAKAEQHGKEIIADLCFGFGQLVDATGDTERAVLLLKAAADLYEKNQADYPTRAQDVQKILDRLQNETDPITFERLTEQAHNLSVDHMLDLMSDV